MQKFNLDPYYDDGDLECYNYFDDNNSIEIIKTYDLSNHIQ